MKTNRKILHPYPKNWKAIRKVVIERDGGLCQHCLRQGMQTPGDHVHHIKSILVGGGHEIDNLIFLCETCHVITRRNIAYQTWSKKKCSHNRLYIYPKKLRKGRSHLMVPTLCDNDKCVQKIPHYLLKYRERNVSSRYPHPNRCKLLIYPAIHGVFSNGNTNSH